MREAPRQRPWVVEWYRPDPRRALTSVWGRGTLFLLLGLALSAPLFAPGMAIGEGMRTPLAVLGVLATGGSALYVIVGMTRLLADESALVLRSDGLVHTRGERSVALDWGDVMGAEAGDDGSLRVLRRHRPPHVIQECYFDADAPTLAKRIEDIRRKALMGLLPLPRPSHHPRSRVSSLR